MFFSLRPGALCVAYEQAVRGVQVRMHGLLRDPNLLMLNKRKMDSIGRAALSSYYSVY